KTAPERPAVPLVPPGGRAFRLTELRSLPDKTYELGRAGAPQHWPPERSDGDRLAVLAEDAAEDVALLAEGRVGGGGAEEVGHQVRLGRAGSRSRVAQAAERRLDFGRIAFAPRPGEPGELRLERTG